MKLVRAIGCFFALAIVGGVGWWLLGAPSTITLTQEDIQRAVDKKFPVEKSEMLFRARLDEPRVTIDSKTDKIGIGVTITVSSPVIKSMTGKGEIAGEPRFDPDARELFLDSPKLTLTEVTGMSESDLRSAEQIVTPLLSGMLSRIPVYTLKEGDLRQPLTNATVRDISIGQGTVTLRFAR